MFSNVQVNIFKCQQKGVDMSHKTMSADNSRSIHRTLNDITEE